MKEICCTMICKLRRKALLRVYNFSFRLLVGVTRKALTFRFMMILWVKDSIVFRLKHSESVQPKLFICRVVVVLLGMRVFVGTYR